jgi:diaminopimelate decarboxylase
LKQPKKNYIFINLQVMENLQPNHIANVFRNALKSGHIVREDSAAIFYNLDFLRERTAVLNSCFPAGTLHGLAIKACPLAGIMSRTMEWDMGVEAASLGEVMLALSLGYNPRQVIYDSPAKTEEDIKFALTRGVNLNLDNFQELERVKNILERTGSKGYASGARPDHGNAGIIGIRVNPQVGEGSIAESSVAGIYSKFGVPLAANRERLIKAFVENDFLTGLHLHVGSQGCSLTLLVDGCGRLYDLMCEINAATMAAKGYPQVSNFDIGGGLPISYFRDRSPASMEDYVQALRKRCPTLFPHPGSRIPNPVSSIQHPAPSTQSLTTDHQPLTTIRLITEFGRWTYTNAAWTVSRVEYVKQDPGVNTAMLHVGADLFVRECLNPKDWPHEYSVLDSMGNLKQGVSENPWNLAGPLCFSGDIIAKGVSLPMMDQGDHLVIHDTGGYTISMWSRYNSRFAPKILGYTGDGKEFVILKKRETMEDIMRFWK